MKEYLFAVNSALTDEVLAEIDSFAKDMEEEKCKIKENKNIDQTEKDEMNVE